MLLKATHSIFWETYPFWYATEISQQLTLFGLLHLPRGLLLAVPFNLLTHNLARVTYNPRANKKLLNIFTHL